MASIEQIVVDYLLEHPRSADTLEGISAWWLAELGKPPTRAELHKALTSLIEDEVLRSSLMADGTPVYSLPN